MRLRSNNLDYWLCFWAGIVTMPVAALSVYFLAHLMPPYSPDLPIEELLARYTSNAPMIQLGMIIWLAVVPFAMQLTMTAALTSLIGKIAGVNAALRYTFFSTGILLAVPGFFLPSTFWTVITFHPERIPALTQIASDVTWLSLITPIAGPCIQEILFGFIILKDRSATPMFPRWAGYFSLWVGFLTIPVVLSFFYQSGPFTWSSLLVFWMPIIIFSYYMMMMYYLIFSAVTKMDRDNRQAEQRRDWSSNADIVPATLS